ncbi:sodium-dependent transporter [Romboutsia weinsteinii]|uniref:Sodium-dependent transporter n=1 Tax=Romboutsia weinsteinii TaxID=2020949 RepID=A0A371J329_9FIRM|nr:sodium-dependent transporter [Romboutsia weinsteinii]RDY27103.1 sodium-dependent transporter [Romboutsia weinsteinii]
MNNESLASNSQKLNKRDVFSNKFGFIVSCVGAALGLGNIWMFSYKLGKYGGAAFLIPYFLFVFVLGSTGLITEFTFGRMFKSGSFSAIKQVFKGRNIKGGSVVGIIPTLGLAGVFMFYSIVIGWILKYFFLSVTGELGAINTTTYFDAFAGTSSTIPWFLLSVLITLSVVGLGVSKGIENLNKVIMPLLLVLFIVLTIKSLSLEGSMAGVEYLLKPRWEHLLNGETWIMALGQAFFTVSLNGCGMVVYGSYINEKFDIPSSAFSTALFDTIAALVASFMIIPAVFAFNLDVTAGPSLLFITVPTIFKSMPYGDILSILFFLSIIFAAISSSVNMLEGIVEAVISSINISRKKASLFIGLICFVLAIPLATNMIAFDNFTNLITIIVSPIGALIVAVVFFYMIDKDTILNEINKGCKKRINNGFIVFGKYVFVLVTIAVTILGTVYGGIG